MVEVEKPRYVMKYLDESVVDTMLEELRKRDAGTTFDDLIYEIHPVNLDESLFVLCSNSQVCCMPLELGGSHETRGICIVALEFEDESDFDSLEEIIPFHTVFFSDRSLEKIRKAMWERKDSAMGTEIALIDRNRVETEMADIKGKSCRCVIRYLEDEVVDAIIKELLKREADITFDDLIYKIDPYLLGYNPFVLYEDEECYCIPLEFEGSSETRGLCVEVSGTTDYLIEEDYSYALDTVLFSDRSLEKIRDAMKERNVSKKGTAE